jgi:uncharacterized protein (DUF4213/DUF364 family)
MSLLSDLVASLDEGTVLTVQVGLHWTAVVVEVEGHRRCGLAANIADADREHGSGTVTHAGRLTEQAALDLAAMTASSHPVEASIGMATVNALLPHRQALWMEGNAGDLLALEGAGKRVVLVGHFPFIPTLRAQVGTLWVLEQRPRAGDLPAAAAGEVVPQADILAITSTTLINRTFDGLMALRRPDALVMLLGPSTPLSPILFDHGVHLLSGSVVDNIAAVLEAVSQGAGFRQIRQAGVRLVTMAAGR